MAVGAAPGTHPASSQGFSHVLGVFSQNQGLEHLLGHRWPVEGSSSSAGCWERVRRTLPTGTFPFLLFFFFSDFSFSSPSPAALPLPRVAFSHAGGAVPFVTAGLWPARVPAPEHEVASPAAGLKASPRGLFNLFAFPSASQGPGTEGKAARSCR